MHSTSNIQHHDLPLPLALINKHLLSGINTMSSEDNNDTRKSEVHHILIVDDSNTERTHLRKLLESEGYTVSEANSGSKAIEMAASILPDLILMDIIMDGGDGYQACRQLKRNEVTQTIPVIMVSSKNNEVDRKWAMKLGATDYIVKPYNDESLLKRLSEI